MPLTLGEYAIIIMDDVEIATLDIEVPLLFVEDGPFERPVEARFGITWERGFEQDMIPLLDRRHFYKATPSAKLVGKKPWETAKGYDQREWRRPRRKRGLK